MEWKYVRNTGVGKSRFTVVAQINSSIRISKNIIVNSVFCVLTMVIQILPTSVKIKDFQRAHKKLASVWCSKKRNM